jgi:hypothetical protein
LDEKRLLNMDSIQKKIHQCIRGIEVLFQRWLSIKAKTSLSLSLKARQNCACLYEKKSTINYKISTINYNLGTINYKKRTINYKIGTINYKGLTINLNYIIYSSQTNTKKS